MKNSHIKIVLFVATFISCFMNISAKVIRTELNAGWQFREARLDNWYPAVVPGVVHLDLMRNKIIEDPYYRLNERNVQWVDKEDWIYQTSFDTDDNLFNCANQVLRFKGLDTYADVYLNDSLILNADNMFREWNVNVKGLLKKSGNVLKVYFKSPIKVDLPKWEALPYHLESDNDQSENGGLLNKKVGVFARKAGYQYGWDWGPRLVTSGIWRPVYLEGWDNAHINNVQLIQKKVDKREAYLQSVVEVEADKRLSDAVITVTANGKVVSKQSLDLERGINKITLNYTMKDPHLWWTNGLGDPYLYDFKTVVSRRGKQEDAKEEKIGIRSLKLINHKDKYGTCLYFELNGVPVFMKGADYVPLDNFLPRVTHSDYEKLILDAKNSNMNMLREWGGGTYECDDFYNLCDKYGILVWQEFMFACSLYPANDAFLANVRQEAIDNVKRLRNHPCIAVWCGNNECQDGWFNWGWKEEYTKQNPAYADTIWNQYKKQYFEVLPEVVKEYGGGTAYRPSSPFATPDGSSDPANGDVHYWSVWHGARLPIQSYNTYHSRFFTEYGFQSFPEYESVKIYAPETVDHNIYSDVMMSHQRGGSFANKCIEDYMLRDYRKPKDFKHFLYVGMLLQGDAIKIAMEAHRRDMPYCMGTMYWQIDDCWPVASWSSRDYYGRWKAVQYFARKAYDRILVSPYVHDDSLSVSIVSDELKPVNGSFEIKVMTLDGKILSDKIIELEAKANTSAVVYGQPLASLLNGEDKGNVIFYTAFKTGGKTYDNVAFAVKQKDMNYTVQQLQQDIKPVSGGYDLTLTASKFARGVFLSLKGIDNFFDDNYFDLLPNTSKTVFVRTKLSLPDFKDQLKVMALPDSYAN